VSPPEVPDSSWDPRFFENPMVGRFLPERPWQGKTSEEQQNLWRSGMLGRRAPGDVALMQVIGSGERMARQTVVIVVTATLQDPCQGKPPPSGGGGQSLPRGRHAGPDHRRLQLPPALPAHLRRSGADVAAIPRDPLRLVPGDPDPGLGQRSTARRRDRLAGQRQDPLAVVLHDDRRDLLHDRPQSRLHGIEEVLQARREQETCGRRIRRSRETRAEQEAPRHSTENRAKWACSREAPRSGIRERSARSASMGG
jgi:hypothetical protein